MSDKDLKFIVTYTGDTVIDEDGNVVVEKGQRKVVPDPSEYENSSDFTVEVSGSGGGEQAPGMLETAIRHGAQGLTYGYGDEIEGAGGATVDWALDPIRNMAAGKRLPEKSWIEHYNERVKKARERNEEAARANSVTAIASDIGGSMIAPGSKALRRAGPIVEGGLQGAAHGVGRGEGSVMDRVGSGITSGFLGTAGAVASELAAPVMKWAGSKVKGLYDKLVPESDEAGLIRSRAQKEIGLSPDEAAKKEVDDLVARQEALSGEIESADDLMRQHGDKLVRDIKYKTVDDLSEGVSGISVSADRVLEEANTGLKGGMAEQKFDRWYSSLRPKQRIEISDNAFRESSKLIDAAEDFADDVINSKGLVETSSGGRAKLLKQGIQKYRSMVMDAASKGASPDMMRETFISLDNLKRQLGKLRAKVKKDPLPREKVEGLYEDFRVFLEDPKVWGSEMSQAQKDINRAWGKYLDVDSAVESSFMRTGKKSTTKAANKFDTVAEFDPKRIQTMLAEPNNPAYKKDLANLKQWLDATDEISEQLTKYYKPSPELRREVARIKELRESVLGNIDNAKSDFARLDKVGSTAQQKALENVDIAKQRGIPETENAKAIRELQAKRSALDYTRGVQGESEQALRGRMEDPILLRERVNADRAYKKALEQKIDDIKGLDRTPLESAVVKGGRAAGRGAVAVGRETFGRKGAPIGAVAGKYGGNAWESAKAMWGDRSTEITSDEDIKASMDAIDAEYGIGALTSGNEKANIKAIEKDPNITKERKEDIYRERAIDDRKRKGGKTTVL